MSALGELTSACRARLKKGQVITEPSELRTYECDGLAHYKVIPALVVLPHTAEQCALTVRTCVAAGVPFVARGSGSGLSGGALPLEDGVLVVLSRLRRILEVDLDNQRVVCEPGVTNVAITAAVGFLQRNGYAAVEPDPAFGFRPAAVF